MRRARRSVPFIAVALLLVGCSDEGDDPEAGGQRDVTQEDDVAREDDAAQEAVEVEKVDVFSLEVGQCFDRPDETEQVFSVDTVPCEEPHDFEVYAVFDLPDGPFPPVDELEEQGGQGCLDRFEAYVEHPYPTSEIFAETLLPSASSWETGDREVICLLFVPGEQLVGSMRGAGR